MARLREEEINEIRAKADIVDVIGRYLPLTRKGKNYVCTCPFHDDHNPSMSVSSDKQIYKCFVCNAGGNVFTFVSNYEKISFIEAVYKVADYTGISIEQPLQLPQRNVDPQLAPLHRACGEAIEFTHYQLDTPQASDVKKYLTSRLIDDSIIKKFSLGYNPPNDSLYKFLHAKKHSDDTLIKAGLCRLTAVGMKDVFAGRIMIPIHNEFGEPVGFSARRFVENSDAKYINTSETDIYVKGNLIFNYHRAKSEARKTKKAILVEGAMDVLAFEKVGMSNALATLGTACTKEQLRLLKQLHVPIIVCYDGDRAGQSATYAFGKLAREAQIPFEIVDNKYGLDPDEIIEEFGKEELRQISEKTISWIDFLFTFLMTKYNLENYTQKKEFAMEMAEEIYLLKDDFEKESYYIRLRELTDFDMHGEEAKKQPKTKTEYVKRSYLAFPKSGRNHAEFEILSQMLNGVAASNHYKEELGFLQDDTCNRLALYIIDYYRTHRKLEVADLFDKIKEEAVKQLLLDVSNWELGKAEVNLKVLNEAIHKVKECLLDDRIRVLNEQIAKIHDPMEKARLAVEKNGLIKEKEEWRNAGRK